MSEQYLTVMNYVVMVLASINFYVAYIKNPIVVKYRVWHMTAWFLMASGAVLDEFFKGSTVEPLGRIFGALGFFVIITLYSLIFFWKREN